MFKADIIGFLPDEVKMCSLFFFFFIKSGGKNEASTLFETTFHGNTCGIIKSPSVCFRAFSF